MIILQTTPSSTNILIQSNITINIKYNKYQISLACASYPTHHPSYPTHNAHTYISLTHSPSPHRLVLRLILVSLLYLFHLHLLLHCLFFLFLFIILSLLLSKPLLHFLFFILYFFMGLLLHICELFISALCQIELCTFIWLLLFFGKYCFMKLKSVPYFYTSYRKRVYYYFVQLFDWSFFGYLAS